MSDTPRTDACWDDESCNILMHARQLERELAEVAKQRDELVRAIRKHKETLALKAIFPGDYDVQLYKALEELEEGGAA